MKLTKTCAKFLRKHGGTILAVAASVGVVATAIETGRATTKAQHILEVDKELTKFNENEFGVTEEPPTKKQIVLMCWKAYVPAAILGGGTIACILGSNALNKKQIAGLTAAYMALGKTYQEYRRQVAEQIGVEEVIEYMDRNFDPVLDSKIKMLYIEQIKNPDKLLYHASSLIRKGCHIAAIKAGSTDVGKRAASSHTGAIANSDSAVEALFRKAGIVRCFSREELTTVASIFTLKEVKGKNCAIITHAGGPAVMLADALEKGRLNVPKLDGPLAAELKSKLYPGAAVGNPIDIIGTGTPEHLATAIDFCENCFEDIDLMMVIFGSPGLVKLYDTYEVLHKKMEECKKPIFPVLPSIVTAGPEVKSFVKKGHVNFSDEVTLGTALSRVLNTPKPMSTDIQLYGVDVPEVRRIIDRLPGSGYLNPEEVRTLLKAAQIPLVEEFTSTDRDELVAFAKRVKFPVVAKVVGPIHKSDMGGVALNIRSEEHLIFEYVRMLRLPDVSAGMVLPMLKGQELFLGAKYEDRFGHVVLCGLGGIFVEVLKDVSYGLSPLSYDETYSMIRSLRGYPIIKGTRGQRGVDEQQYADIIVRLSTLLRFASEIKEMDINPLVATERGLFAVDARIRIEK